MENYLYPFFWQHGEPEEVIMDYMDRISEGGMKAVCVEARPHPEFLSDKWWKDMGTILKKAKQHGMRIWILDDSHFPTGYANGRIEKVFPEYQKIYLYHRRFDITGPMKGARINAGILTGRPWEKPGLGDKKLIGIYLAKRSRNRTEKDVNLDAVDFDSLTVLENAWEGDNIIKLDIPSGSYSVFVVFTTREGGEEATKGYLNPLVKEATKILLDEVYEPHYQHLKEEFGKTITAFFSDEPRFGNVKGPNAVIGADMVLPWREGLEQELPFDAKCLPLLWHHANGEEYKIRYQYMDVVTRLYSENFTGVLAEWCHAHGVMYLGHNIEDEGAHCRLGYGAGHYFRAQKDQDYAGIDVIGTQIVPGMPYHHDAFSTGGNNGEFYHYALGKLAGSAAHLDPQKKGRAMCEAFGAYGWNEGLKMMKWIADHLLSRGINTFVPHAFNPKAFPDWDCPPHFYAHGNNPQYRYFPVFSNYVNRMAGLLQNGRTATKVSVLYHGKLEWCGKCMPVEKILRELCEHQIDADIISEDYLEDAVLSEGMFSINGQDFEILFVPKAERIPEDLAEKLNELKGAGVQVVYVNDEVPLDEIAEKCGKLREISLSVPFRELAYYHYRTGEQDVLMFFNESITDVFHSDIRLLFPEKKKYLYRYDAFGDRYTEAEAEDFALQLALMPYESAVYILTDKEQAAEKEKKASFRTVSVLADNWKVYYADAQSYPDFGEKVAEGTLQFLSEQDGFEDKAGTVAYETEFEADEKMKYWQLDIGQAYETAEVFVNEKSAGIRIAPPYRFDITEHVQHGTNRLRVEVTNTLGTAVRDGMSQYLVIEPFGMSGEVRLEGAPVQEGE